MGSAWRPVTYLNPPSHSCVGRRYGLCIDNAQQASGCSRVSRGVLVDVSENEAPRTPKLRRWACVARVFGALSGRRPCWSI